MHDLTVLCIRVFPLNYRWSLSPRLVVPLKVATYNGQLSRAVYLSAPSISILTAWPY